MRKISLVILFLGFSISSIQATNYYVSNKGSDRNNGKSPRKAWNSLIPLQKIKLFSGDSILLECGSTIVGSLEIKYSGEVNNPIVIASYGTGDAPILSGASDHTTNNVFINIKKPTYEHYKLPDEVETVYEVELKE